MKPETPEALSGFKREGFNQTRNPFGFQTGLFKPNLKPFEVSCFRGGVESKPETFSGFKLGGLNQTRKPLRFRVSEARV